MCFAHSFCSLWRSEGTDERTKHDQKRKESESSSSPYGESSYDSNVLGDELHNQNFKRKIQPLRLSTITFIHLSTSEFAHLSILFNSHPVLFHLQLQLWLHWKITFLSFVLLCTVLYSKKVEKITFAQEALLRFNFTFLPYYRILSNPILSFFFFTLTYPALFHLIRSLLTYDSCYHLP